MKRSHSQTIHDAELDPDTLSSPRATDKKVAYISTQPTIHSMWDKSQTTPTPESRTIPILQSGEKSKAADSRGIDFSVNVDQSQPTLHSFLSSNRDKPLLARVTTASNDLMSCDGCRQLSSPYDLHPCISCCKTFCSYCAVKRDRVICLDCGR